MDSRRRFHSVMNYEPFDRGIYLFPWFGFPETLEVWKRDQNYRDGDFNRYRTDQWIWCADLFYPHPPFEEKIIEEDERQVLLINSEGILMRVRKDQRYSSMPQFVRFPVGTREEFRAFARERLRPNMAERMGPNWAERMRAWRRDPTEWGRENWACMKSWTPEPAVFWLWADRWGGFFGPLRNLVGVEDLCRLFYNDPAFLEEMMDTIAEFVIEMMRQILDAVEIDVFSFWEDMAFKLGPLISPDLARRHMFPYYRRVVEYVRGRGVKWIALDSDGNIESLLPIWLDAGINLIFPFEVNSGMDVVALRAKFGRALRMFGGIDKRALAGGPRAIDAEIERVRPLIEAGGYAAAPDHSIPPDITFENFKYYMDRMARVLGVSND